MFQTIDFAICRSNLEMNGEEFLLGELTTEILNITVEEYVRMRELVERGTFESLTEVHTFLRRKQFFRLNLYPTELLSPKEYRELLNDLYSFNQTMFWFIDRFLMALKKLDAENYAAALYNFFHHPSAYKRIVNPLQESPLAFTVSDEIAVAYDPREIPGQPGAYAIYEIYRVHGLQGFLKMDFMRALIAGHCFRRCRNCKRFFLSTQGYHTDYCDRPLEGNPKRRCRNQGAKNGAKEKAANNPVIRGYNRAYQRIFADRRRGRISEADWERSKQRIADLRDMATSGRLSDRELEDSLQPKQLYGELNIVRKGRR